MTEAISLNQFYRSATEIARRRLDDVAAQASVGRLQAMCGDRPVFLHGPVRAFAAIGALSPDPAKAARALTATGRPIAMSMTVHRNMPGLGASSPPVDVAELQPGCGGPSYWFAASPERERALGSEAPVLLFGQQGEPDIAVFATSLRAALTAAQADRTPPLAGALREIVADARDRVLAVSFPRPTLAAMAERQALLAEATASHQARQWAAPGTAPVVPLRVVREDLTGEAEGPVAQMIQAYDWTVRQPVTDARGGAVSRYVEGRDGVASLSASFGHQPTRVLCLDASLLEFDAVRRATTAQRADSLHRIAATFRAAVGVSSARDKAHLARQLTDRSVTQRQAYGVRR